MPVELPQTLLERSSRTTYFIQSQLFPSFIVSSTTQIGILNSSTNLPTADKIHLHIPSLPTSAKIVRSRLKILYSFFTVLYHELKIFIFVHQLNDTLLGSWRHGSFLNWINSSQIVKILYSFFVVLYNWRKILYSPLFKL